ncbi:DUF5011 domain-containing protein [Bifidobacterium sp. SMA15]|uniref:DUF5011 domain-containing protein n=2 Tax=Bifidobacterium platyrrhinorum TaxID=2661628 RepID=A0A6L9SR81_9BIFI|nr:DUF5011 domain-containing protein [Bifidobacterium platyrrhinorum]
MHVSRRSRRALAAARARRIALAALAVVVFVAAVALPTLVVPALSGTGATTAASRAATGATAASPAHGALARKAVPANDPGDIVIGVNGSAVTTVLKGEAYVEGGAHAIEPEDGVLTGAIRTSGDVDTSRAGDYPVRYTVRDSHGHVASTVRTVKVVDAMDPQTGGLPVLMYHYIYDPANPPADLNANYIAADALEKQLEYLAGHGFYQPSWPEVRAYVDGTHTLPAHSVVLTFDDGEPGFFTNGCPLFTKYRVAATSFVITSDGNAPQRMKDCKSPYLEYESHSNDMHRAGGTVGHGGRISAMSRQEIVDDLAASKRVTGSLQAFAYPFGDTTADARAAVKDAGALVAFTTQYGRAQPGDDPMDLPRVRVQGDESLDAFVAAVS